VALVLDLVGVGVAVFVTLPAAYLAFLAVVTIVARPATVERPNTAPDDMRFAILVPAHDEEDAIGETIGGLLALDYPRNLFTVHVVADNCSDATAAVARRHGACVHERSDSQRRGKGAALNWLAEEIATETREVNAFVFVDADCKLSRDFLAVMSDHLRDGAGVVQALHLVTVSEDRPLVRIRELAFRLGNHLRPLAYAALGASCPLLGTGMCFAAEEHRRYRWSETSVVEDGELSLRLVRDGHRVALASGATVRQVMPTTFGAAGSQAVRWERARFDHFSEGVRLAWRGARRRQAGPLLAGLGILVPPTAVIAGGSGGAILIGAAAGRADLIALGMIALGALLLYAARGASLGGMAPRVVLRILVWAPAYAAWKLGVIALAAVGSGRREWRRSARVA